VEGGRDRPHPHARRSRLNHGKQKERRAKAARRSLAFTSPRPPLRDFTKEIRASRADVRRRLMLPANRETPSCPQNTRAGRLFAAGSKVRGPAAPATRPKRKPSGVTRGFVADFFGANPVASALGIRSGATPRGRIHCNIRSSALPAKEDISTWQKRGHFYLALTSFIFHLLFIQLLRLKLQEMGPLASLVFFAPWRLWRETLLQSVSSRLLVSNPVMGRGPANRPSRAIWPLSRNRPSIARPRPGPLR
jgi:hypothetical protein